MIYLLYIIITLLVAIVYSIQTRIWQAETYHLENKYPLGKNKSMDNALLERNHRMGNMIWSQLVWVFFISAIISAVIFGILFVLQSFEIINFINL
jgi:hypothetical protein